MIANMRYIKYYSKVFWSTHEMIEYANNASSNEFLVSSHYDDIDGKLYAIFGIMDVNILNKLNEL